MMDKICESKMISNAGQDGVFKIGGVWYNGIVEIERKNSIVVLRVTKMVILSCEQYEACLENGTFPAVSSGNGSDQQMPVM